MNVDLFVSRYPNLYHMAEKDSWPSIRQSGLLSTSASLRLLGIHGERRDALEHRHRPDKVAVESPAGLRVVLRDQKPMPPCRIAVALEGAATPEDWYSLINSKVFFWVARDRLLRLLGARAYRDEEHDVITVDSSTFVRAYEKSITICHMNSGNTFPVPHRRDVSIFRSIADYPTNNSGNPSKDVVELTVADQVPDIAKYVTKVSRMKGDKTVLELPI